MHHFTPIPALLGGVLIGLAVSSLFLTHGRAAGISGLWGGLFAPAQQDRPTRLFFFAGLIGTGFVVRLVYPQAFGAGATGSFALVAAAGLLVGYGTRLGSGCTSGHGVCGISRFEVRSIVATITFMLVGAFAVFAARVLS